LKVLEERSWMWCHRSKCSRQCKGFLASSSPCSPDYAYRWHLDSLSGLGQVNNCLEPPLQTFHMCHQGKGGPYRYCEPVKCSWKYCVFYVFFVDVLHFLCFVFVMVKKHTANNLYTKVRHLFLGPSKYFSPKYEVVTASCVFFCVIGSFRVPSC